MCRALPKLFSTATNLLLPTTASTDTTTDPLAPLKADSSRRKRWKGRKNYNESDDPKGTQYLPKEKAQPAKPSSPSRRHVNTLLLTTLTQLNLFITSQIASEVRYRLAVLPPHHPQDQASSIPSCRKYWNA